MSSKYRLVLFDMDGTLTDSGPGILDCVRRTIRYMGCPELPYETLRKFIGPPTFYSFSVYCGLPPEKAERAVRYFRGIYAAGGAYNNSVYDGMQELLQNLRSAGIVLAVATSKPESQAHNVLDYFGLTEKFDFVSAADESDKESGKEKLILRVLRESGILPGAAVMIGDTKYDAAGARKAGVDFIGVLYGFGTEEEMRREGGRQFAGTVDSLGEMLLDKRRAAVV